MKLATWVGWKPWTAAVVCMVVHISLVLAQDTRSQRATLAGLTGVNVLVEGMNPDVERDGLARSTLQTDVELRLRQASIRVLTETEMLLAPGKPFLYLRVSSFKGREGVYAVAISLELKQSVRLVRDPALTLMAATWQSIGAIGLGGPSKARDTVRDEVDKFINAYLAANPKR